jgi:hypothetical protein
VAALRIPKELQSVLADLVTVDDSAFAELLDAVKNAQLAFTTEALATNVVAKITHIPEDRVESIIELLTGLHFIRSGVSVPLDDFVDDLLEGAEEDLGETLSKVRDQAKQRLMELLGQRTIGFAAKARETERNFERSYCKAEMLTDIRPMFDNGDGAPLAAVLTYTLKITYHQRERMKDFFVTLTSDDLSELEDLVNQARFESEQLAAILEKAKIVHPKDASTLPENKSAKMLKSGPEQN